MDVKKGLSQNHEMVVWDSPLHAEDDQFVWIKSDSRAPVTTEMMLFRS